MMHFVVNCEPIFMLCAVSAESRALMQQVLASEADNAEVSSRVQALLAGSNLTTPRDRDLDLCARCPFDPGCG